MIKIKTPEEIEQMKKAGALSKMVLRHVGAMVRPGVSTFELDQLAEQIIRMHGGTPAFKGYGGFPGTICASLNDAVVHGIPNPDVILRDGDILSIDTGAIVDGWVGDNAWTFYVGNPAPEVKALCEVTLDCLKAGIEQAVPGTASVTSAMPFKALPRAMVTACFASTWDMAWAVRCTRSPTFPTTARRGGASRSKPAWSSRSNR